MLDTETPTLAVPLPHDAETTTLEIEARSIHGEKALRLGPLPARSLSLALPSFPEYGPHRIPIQAVFDDDSTLLVIDLAPEDQAETAAAPTVVALTPNQTWKEWSYLASSPFRAGYRFRRHTGVDDEPGPWSEIRSPFAPLVLSAATVNQ